MAVLSTFPDFGTLMVFAVVLLIIWMYRSTKLPASFPPGPRPLPIIGNLGAMSSMETITALRDKYGPVIGLKLGSIPTVLLSSAESVKEALVERAEDFTSRPHFLHAWTLAFSKGDHVRGVIWTNGHLWRESRRFSLSSMKDFGMGRRTVEERLYDEANDFCDVLATFIGRPYDMCTLTQQAASNIICSLCFGSRFEYSDSEFIKMMAALNRFVEGPYFTALSNYIPALKYIPFQGWINESATALDDVYVFIEKQIALHRPTLDRENPRDFIDLYLIREAEGQEDQDAFCRDNLQAIIRDLFQAGSETTSTGLRWLLLYMIRFPNLQRRCQEELDLVVGTGRRPTLADRCNLPYVDACIHEMLRLCNIAPLAGPRNTKRDTKLAGYSLPTNTMVLTNLYAVHTDPRYWEEPLVFRPERWLDQDGTLRKRESFMPFGAGPRLCPGESLARIELFVFFTFMLQRFSFSIVEGVNPPPLEGVLGQTLSPVRYDVIVRWR